MTISGDSPRQRLARYKEFVDLGVYPDVRSAVKALTPLRTGEIANYKRRRDAKEYWRKQKQRAERAQIEARKISSALRREVLAGGECAYCGYEATCIDHIVPVSKGGTRRRGNLAPACEGCNENKLDFTPAEWKAYRQEMGLPWPPQSIGVWLVEAAVERYQSDLGFRAWVDEAYGDPTNPISVPLLSLSKWLESGLSWSEWVPPAGLEPAT